MGRRLYVGNLPYKATDEELTELFSRAGAVDNVRVMRDQARPEYLAPAFDSGDHLHPNDAGYRAMAASIDVRLFDAVK